MSASVTGTTSNRRLSLAVPLLAAGLALTVVLAGGAARAADQAGGGDAKARYISGQSHYNLNEFAEALQDFKEAYRLRPDPAFLFNIAQCERQLGNLEEAIKFYRSYLRNKPDAGNKREIEKKIDELKGLIEAKKKATTGAPQSVIPPAAVDEQGGRGATPARPVEPAPPPAPPEPTPAAATTQPAPATTPAPAVVPPLPSSSSSPSSSSPATPGVDLTAHPSADDGAGAQPIYRHWWFWAGAGAVVVVVGVVAAVALSGGSSPPASGLGSQRVF